MKRVHHLLKDMKHILLERKDIHTHNSHPNVSLSFVDITGRTRLSVEICDTRENKNIAASKDWKNMRAPAKKKFPMLQVREEWADNHFDFQTKRTYHILSVINIQREPPEKREFYQVNQREKQWSECKNMQKIMKRVWSI